MTSAAALVQPSAAKSRWKKAYDSLDPALRANFQAARTSKKDVLAAVLKTAEQKREICINKQWKVKLPGSDRVIIVRDVVDKIVNWIKLFASAGDVAAQYDPGTAAFPWAAVRFVLQAAISDSLIEGAMVADLEVIARLIVRYAEFERIHIEQNASSIKTQLEEGLARLYAGVLEFLAMSVRYFTPNTFVRGLKNAFKVPDREVMEGVIQHEAELLKMASISEAEKLLYLESSMTRLLDQTTRTQKTMEEEKHLQLLTWLSRSPYTRHHEALSDARMPNSTAWVQNHLEYRDWANSSSSAILLLHGIPGSGKSNACSAVVNTFLQAQAQAASNHQLAAPIAYFYCAECEFEPDRSRADEVLRSLLRQLTTTANQTTVRDIIATEFEQRLAQSKVDGFEMSRLTVQQCVKLILEVTITEPIVIALDALDRVSTHDRPDLIRALVDVVKNSSSVVKVFLTSRNDSQIFSLLQGGNVDFKRIQVGREDTLHDIEMYVKQEVTRAVRNRRLMRKDLSAELSDLLVQKLVAGAAEMFQWVNIQIEYLCRLSREEDVAEALVNGKSSLATLHDTYALILARILDSGSTACQIAIQAFSWLLYMKESMAPDAFLAAITTHESASNPRSGFPASGDRQADLATICSSLVLLDVKCNTFRFAHHSVNEFLQMQDRFSPASAQQLLAARCLEMCRHGPSTDFSPASPSGGLDTFYRYATIYWAHHASVAISFSSTSSGSSSGENATDEDILSFVYDAPGDVTLSFCTWLDHVESISKQLADEHPARAIQEAMPNSQCSPVFVAGAFGLDCILKNDNLTEESETFDWDQRNGQGHTSLYLASASGHDSTARLLLAHGADPNARCGKFGNSLQAACFYGHTAIIQLLIQYGASVRAEGIFSNAFEACFRGLKEESAMALLTHACSTLLESDFETAFRGAAQAGFLQVIEWLTASPLSPSQYRNHVDDKDKMRLKTRKAIQGGQAGTLAIFLKNKADVADKLPSGPVALAALYGHETVVELLIGLGFGLEDPCKLGPPLRCAALAGHEPIARRLMSLGANVNSCSSHHGTALEAAAAKGHIRIVKLLLRNGASVDQKTDFYGTALQACAYHGHRDIVEELIDAGADVHKKGMTRDAFHAAAEGGHYDVVKLLLDKGYKFLAPPTSFRGRMGGLYGLIGWRAKSRLKDYARQLDQMGPKRRSLGRIENEEVRTASILSPDMESDIEWREPPLSDLTAVKNRYQAVKSQADNARIPDESDYALQACTAAGNLELVEMLLDPHCRLRASRYEVESSLETAATAGHIQIFRLLLSSLSAPFPVQKLLMAIEKAAIHGYTDILDCGIQHLPVAALTRENVLDLVSAVCQTSSVYSATTLWSDLLESSPVEMGEEILGMALVEAATLGNATVAGYVLGFGTETVADDDIREAFEAACEGGHIPTVSVLLTALHDNHDILHALGYEGLILSASKGYTELLILLIQSLSSLAKPLAFTRPLIAAAGNGRLEAVKQLIQQQGLWEDRSEGITQALTVASGHGHADVVEFLILSGAQINAIVPIAAADPRERIEGPSWYVYPHVRMQGRYRKVRSNRNGYIDARVQARRNIGRPLPEDRINALQAALFGSALFYREPSYGVRSDPWKEGTMSDREKVIKILLNHGADTNNLGGLEEYPITSAIQHCSEQVVSWLIESGADVNAVGTNGVSAVLATAKRETSAAGIIRRLLDAGVFIQSETQSVSDVLDASLKCFRQRVGFNHLDTLEDVFAEGPGALVQIILEESPTSEARLEGFPEMLQCAAAIGDKACVELLLSRGVDVNAVVDHYGTALQAASHCNRTSIVEQLLEAGADPNLVGGHYQTAFRAAVVGGHTFIVKLLLQWGADASMSVPPDRFSGKPVVPVLNLAIISDNTDVVSLLAPKCLDILDVHTEHSHPLVLASGRGKLEVVQALLQIGPAPGTRSRSMFASETMMASLQEACRNGHADVVRLLLSLRPDVDKEPQVLGTLLQKSAIDGRREILCLFLSAGADVNHMSKPGHSALSMAAAKGHVDVVRELLAAGAIVYDREKKLNALKDACNSQCLLLVELLLEETSSLPHGDEAIIGALQVAAKRRHAEMFRLFSEYLKPSLQLLHQACVTGMLDVVTMALNAGVPVNGQTSDGAQALTLAARHLHVEVVKLLVNRGADLDYGHPIYGTALSAAVYCCVKATLPKEILSALGHTPQGLYWGRTSLRPSTADVSKCEKIVRFLLGHGAQLDAEPRPFGHTLHIASYLGSTAVISALLAAGADVHAESGYFGLPLFAAIDGGSLEAVNLLLEAGSQLEWKHPHLGTPLFLASQTHQLHLVQLLLHFGADPNVVGPDGSSPLSEIQGRNREFRQRPNSPSYSPNIDVLRMFQDSPCGLKPRDTVG